MSGCGSGTSRADSQDCPNRHAPSGRYGQPQRKARCSPALGTGGPSLRCGGVAPATTCRSPAALPSRVAARRPARAPCTAPVARRRPGSVASGRASPASSSFQVLAPLSPNEVAVVSQASACVDVCPLADHLGSFTSHTSGRSSSPLSVGLPDCPGCSPNGVQRPRRTRAPALRGSEGYLVPPPQG